MSYQYRITVNGDARMRPAYPGEQWSRVSDACDDRGYTAKLERRLITDLSMLNFYPDGLPAGWARIGERIICAWEVLAEIGQERRCVIVG